MQSKNTLAVALWFVILTVLAVLIEGWSVVWLWKWFVAEAFNLPAITIAQAVGLCMVISLIAQDGNTSSEDDLLKQVGRIFLRPVVALLLGYIVHLFV